jgi:DNA primase
MFDMLAVVDAGYRHVVSCIGSDLSDEQARLLLHLGHPVVLLFDADDAGRAGARKAAGKLIRGAFVRAVTLPEGKDPADVSGEQLRRHLSFLL